MLQIKKDLADKRKYIRVNTVFPVEFRLAGKDAKLSSEWLQGFSRDIGKGGIGLSANLIEPSYWDRITNQDCSLELKIHLPFRKSVINAQTEPVWCRKPDSQGESKFFVGLKFIKIL